MKVTTHRSCWLLLLGLLGAPAMSNLHAQATTAHDRSRTATFRLVRCGPQRNAACLTASLALPPDAVIGSARDSVPLQWGARLGGAMMIGPMQPLVSGATQPDLAPVFGAPIVKGTALGRAALRGEVVLAAGSRTAAAVPALWRPPHLTLPSFEGAADSLSIPLPVREALAAGSDPASVRPLLAFVLALIGSMLVAFGPRYLWRAPRESDEDMARQVVAARALLSTQELEELRGKAPREVPPRRPEDPTHESAILPRP